MARIVVGSPNLTQLLLYPGLGPAMLEQHRRSYSLSVPWFLQNVLLTNVLYAAAVDGNEPVQMKIHKSLKLWSFYVDLEESLGTLESTRAVYERILDLRIATPQIVLNYAYLIEVKSMFKVHFSKFPVFSLYMSANS
jgi:hypothetical protein